MRNIVNILGNGKVFPFLIESVQDRSYKVSNRFNLMFPNETSAASGTDQYIVSGNVVSSDGSVEDVLYRSVNDFEYGKFDVAGTVRDVPPDSPVRELEEIQDVIDGTSEYAIIDGVKYYIDDNEQLVSQYGEDPSFPESMYSTVVRIVVPDFYPSVYSRHLRYYADVVTRIGAKKICLSSKIFTSDDLLTLDRPFNDGGHRYTQYIDIPIPDPWDMCYSDDYSTFRKEYCYETAGTNNCGSILDVEIGVVSEDSTNDGYIPSSEYSSGRNLLLLGGGDSDYMTLMLTDSGSGTLEFFSELVFNRSYGGDLKEYIEETYFIELDKVMAEIVVMDENSIYKIDSVQLDLSKKPEATFSTDYLRFDSWEDYSDGMYVVSVFRLFSKVDGEELETIDIRSNHVPMTKELFSQMVGPKIEIIENTLDEMNIDINTVDVVNKIQKNIVTVARPDDYKSNIIRPVFYHAYDSSNIELHNAVTFNIGIDLDNYKTKVSNFSLQIEGIVFPEIGRVPGYVLFTIAGNKLPKDNQTGTYYVLDGDGIMVTKGKYMFTE